MSIKEILEKNQNRKVDNLQQILLKRPQKKENFIILSPYIISRGL